MEIMWSMRTDNDILKIPKKAAYRYAGLERGLKCLKAGCEIEAEDEKVITKNEKLLRGFADPNNIPEANQKAAEEIKILLAGYGIQIADIDLETDLMNSGLHDVLIAYYGEEGDSDETVIAEMQKRKGLNMYHFLQEKKEALKKLEKDRLAELLFDAQEYIENKYGPYASPT